MWLDGNFLPDAAHPHHKALKDLEHPFNLRLTNNNESTWVKNIGISSKQRVLMIVAHANERG